MLAAIALSICLNISHNYPLTEESLPNIVFILSDDIGYGDLSCYGADKVRTENIDRLAKQGIRFTDAHSPSAVCTPTRYSLLTGRYAFRDPQGAGILSGVAPLCIKPDVTTLPKILKEKGYQTGVVGKWHLGLGEKATDYNGVIKPGPKEVGFDYSFILPATGDRVPCVYVENGRVVNADPSDQIQVNYRQKVGTDPTGKERPDLLKVKAVVGHTDTIVNGVSRIGFMSGGNRARWIDEDMADTFVNQANSFISRNRKRPFFLYLATHDIHAPQLPNKRFWGKSQCGLRGDTILELDSTVGLIMATLEELKLADNTIVVFTSDNGATDSDGYSDPRENLNGHKVNGALRGEKYTLYEGGHRVPFIVRWPAKIKPAQVSPAMISIIDMLSSTAGLIKRDLRNDEAPDSENVIYALLGRSPLGRNELVLHKGGFGAPVGLRQGRWMFIPNANGQDELYNLEDDLVEKTNLAKSFPSKCEAMKYRLEQIKAAKSTR